MSDRNEILRVDAMLEAQQLVVAAVLEHEHATKNGESSDALRKIMAEAYRLAHRVDAMRVKNLLEAVLNLKDEPGYQDYVRRN